MKKIALIGLCLTSLTSTVAFSELTQSTTPHPEGPFECRWFEHSKDAKNQQFNWFLCNKMTNMCNYCKQSGSGTGTTSPTDASTTTPSGTTTPTTDTSTPAPSASPASNTSPAATTPGSGTAPASK